MTNTFRFKLGRVELHCAECNFRQIVSVAEFVSDGPPSCPNCLIDLIKVKSSKKSVEKGEKMSVETEQKQSIVPFVAHTEGGEFSVEGDYLVIKLHKVMLGSMSNHLKATPQSRKASRSMRRLGYVLQDAATTFYSDPQ